MKIFQKIEVKSKKEFYIIKEKKIYSFFRVYHKFVKFVSINKYIYVLILLVEYLQLFYEISIDNEDFVSHTTESLKKTSSFKFFRIMQYLNFSHFINGNYLNLNQYLIIYIIVISIIILNFSVLFLLDYLDKRNSKNRKKFKFIHQFFAWINFLFLRAFLIPIIYILIKSYYITTFSKELTQTTSNETGTYSNILTNSADNTKLSYIWRIIIYIVTTLILPLELFILSITSLLFNDLDPIEAKLCWSQSYSQIEIFNIIMKVVLVVYDCIGHLEYPKSVSVLALNIGRCSFRFIEWFYAWNTNQIFLIILDFSLLFYNLLLFIKRELIRNLDYLLLVYGICIIIGIFFYYLVLNIQENIFEINSNNFTSERQYCQLIIKLINIIKNLSNEEKTINDPKFFGFLRKHQKNCINPFCISKIIKNLMNDGKSPFFNEIEGFIIKKEEFNLYCKANKDDTFEILPENSINKCQKVIYSLISCIISSGIKNLPKDKVKILPIIEAYVFIHIFDNNFYALFQIMKYYKANIDFRSKFYFFSCLNEVLLKIEEEMNNKVTTLSDISFVTDYYFYHEEFFITLNDILPKTQNMFYYLINMKPSPQEILSDCDEIGKKIGILHRSFNNIIKKNPYEINILRLYSFILDKIYLMKKTSSQQKIRLNQNIRYYLLNDRFRNYADKSKNDGFNKNNIKNFEENSDSAVIIVSGVLDKLGIVLYSNILLNSIVGYDKSELIGTSINKIIPKPISDIHNNLILNFYRTGKRKFLDTINNLLCLHKNQTLINVDLYLCCLPNLEYGLMFIGLIKNSYNFKLNLESENDKSESSMLQIEGHNFFIGANDNILKNESTNKNDLSSSSRSPTTSRINNSKLITSNLKSTNRDADTTGLQKGRNNPSGNKVIVYKFNDTGFIFLDKYLDIMHMNFYALVNFFGLTHTFPPKKVNIQKVIRDFTKKKIEFESGENVNVFFDLTLFEKIFSKHHNYDKKENDLLMGTNLSNETKILKKLKSISITKKRSAKISVKKIYLTSKEYYYLITVTKGDNINQNFSSDLSSEDESDFFMIGNSDNENISETSFSNMDFFGNENDEKSKIHTIEKQKNILLNNKYFPKFLTFTTILIYIFSLLSCVWFIIVYYFEFRRLIHVKHKFRIYNKIGNLINTFAYYVISSFFSIGNNLLNLTNIKDVITISEDRMKEDRISIYDIIYYLASDFSVGESKLFRNALSSQSLSFNGINVDGEFFIEKLNLETAINKFLYNMNDIINQSSYTELTIQQFFNNSYINRLKSKIFFNYFNYFQVFQGTLEYVYNQYTDSIYSKIFKRRNLIIYYCIIGIIFELLCMTVIIIILFKIEKFKKNFLLFIAGIYDIFFEEKSTLLRVFQNNLNDYLLEDQNFHSIKTKIENDREYKQKYINGENFLHKIIEKHSTSNTLLRKSKLKKSMNEPTTSFSFYQNLSEENQKLNTKEEDKKISNNLSTGKIHNDKNKIIINTKEVEFDDNSNTNVKKNLVSSRSKVTYKDISLKKSDILNNDEKKKEDSNENNNNEQEFEKENEEEEEEEEKKILSKSYANYEVSLLKYIPFIFIVILILNLFYIISIYLLYDYSDYLIHILYDENLTHTRIKTLNNIILSMNMILVIRTQSFLGNNQSIINFIKKSSETEENFKKILKDISKNSNIYSTLISYDKSDPCNYFNGFGINYSDSIKCTDYILSNGISYQISQIINDLNSIYIQLRTYNLLNDIENIYNMYMSDNFVRIMIQNNFFIRYYLNDISVTYYDSYIDIINGFIQLIHGKFYIFILILLFSIICYRLIFVNHFKKTINNLSRIKVFFDDDTFELLI